jgi:hypothetical protein
MPPLPHAARVSPPPLPFPRTHRHHRHHSTLSCHLAESMPARGTPSSATVVVASSRVGSEPICRTTTGVRTQPRFDELLPPRARTLLSHTSGIAHTCKAALRTTQGCSSPHLHIWHATAAAAAAAATGGTPTGPLGGAVPGPAGAGCRATAGLGAGARGLAAGAAAAAHPGRHRNGIAHKRNTSTGDAKHEDAPAMQKSRTPSQWDSRKPGTRSHTHTTCTWQAWACWRQTWWTETALHRDEEGRGGGGRGTHTRCPTVKPSQRTDGSSCEHAAGGTPGWGTATGDFWHNSARGFSKALPRAPVGHQGRKGVERRVPA